MTLAQIYTSIIVILIIIGYVFAFAHMLPTVSEPNRFWRQYTTLTVAMFVMTLIVVVTARWVR